MKNPFEHNTRTLKPGFYFDKKLKLICFYYVEENEFYTHTEVYNRNKKDKPKLPPGMIMLGGPVDKTSDVEDLVELKLEVLTDKNSLAKDFKWLLDNSNVSHTFVDYLLAEEKYLLLDLFKPFVEHQNK